METETKDPATNKPFLTQQKIDDICAEIALYADILRGLRGSIRMVRTLCSGKRKVSPTDLDAFLTLVEPELQHVQENITQHGRCLQAHAIPQWPPNPSGEGKPRLEIISK